MALDYNLDYYPDDVLTDVLPSALAARPSLAEPLPIAVERGQNPFLPSVEPTPEKSRTQSAMDVYKTRLEEVKKELRPKRAELVASFVAPVVQSLAAAMMTPKHRGWGTSYPSKGAVFAGNLLGSEAPNLVNLIPSVRERQLEMQARPLVLGEMQAAAQMARAERPGYARMVQVQTPQGPVWMDADTAQGMPAYNRPVMTTSPYGSVATTNQGFKVGINKTTGRFEVVPGQENLAVTSNPPVSSVGDRESTSEQPGTPTQPAPTSPPPAAAVPPPLSNMPARPDIPAQGPFAKTPTPATSAQADTRFRELEQKRLMGATLLTPAETAERQAYINQKLITAAATAGRTLNTQMLNRANHSYEYNNNLLDKLDKDIVPLVMRLGRLHETLEQGSPQADALIAPELLTVMAGGMGSGLRMNEAEISRIIGGRSKWESLKAAANTWRADPSAANSITPDQRQQIRSLVNAVGQKLYQKQQVLDDARQALINTDDVHEHRRIIAGAKASLLQIDNPEAGKASDRGRAIGGGQVKVQRSPSTGQYRYSTDGGKTWLSGLPPNQ